MKFQDIKENGGRVVKGVNTTPDVGTDAIKKQAAKFGNTVDKDGRPPTLSKKVKGSKTNVLFNLGMSEAINERSLIKNKENKKTNEDLQKEIAQPSEIYVDMDGVLADFFGEWARLMDVDHFTDINKKHDINDALQKIRDTDDFWLRLPLLPEAKKLLNLIKQIKGEYYICTSPLADDPNSEKHKRTWVEENLAFFPPKAVYVTHNKPQYATGKDGTPNILIDDYGVNIRNWEAAGGVGFKYKDHKFERTAKSIKQHMQEPVEEGLGAIAKGAVNNVKNTATAVKLIHKYFQTGLEQDAFAAIKHGWQWIKNPKMRSRIVKLVKKMATDDGLDWNQTVAHIKKNTGIDVSNVNEKAVSIKQQPVEEGSVTVPARQLHDMVLKLVNDVDYNDTKTLAKIARTLGKEVFYKNDRVVLQDPDFDFYQDKNENFTEGYKLQLERDTDMMVLHIKDTATGKRTEVRGKSGYESGNYDADDKLHQLLDKVGKSVDISQLMNGEPVGINPKHPDGASAKDATDKAYAEGNLLANPQNSVVVKKEYPYDWYKIGTHIANLDNVSQHIKDRNRQDIYIQFFGGEKEKEFMMKKLGAIGYDVQDADGYRDMHFDENTEGSYILRITENFADGKKKGKSRPGRVKRAGASCNGSVTALRKRAKNASGEKAKMYHWCANMKSGRKKK